MQAKSKVLPDRIWQFLFSVSLLGCCWLGMMAVHEAGHVLGAMIVGARIEKVVLHPLSISSTTVAPNSNPRLVVWLGPLVGCLIPFLLGCSVPGNLPILANSFRFFSGFCLIANGVYIGFGSFWSIGDCDELLANGTAQWTLILFGAIATVAGLTIWHRLGSIENFLRNPQRINMLNSLMMTALLTALIIAGVCFSLA